MKRLGELEKPSFILGEPSFLDDLEEKDLLRLRAVTARVLLKNGYRPNLPTIDMIIRDMGPRVAERQVREAVDTKEIS